MDATFYGYVFEPTGYGAASRGYIHALSDAGINLSVVNLGSHKIVSDRLVESLIDRPMTSTLHICHAEAPQMTLLQKHFPRLIAITTWETDRLSEKWTKILNNVLEVWVPCRYNLDVFERSLKIPVFRLPHAFQPAYSQVASGISEKLGIGQNDFVFYSIITWQERKNPLGIIEAFLRAFPNQSDVVLVIKTMWGLTLERIARAHVARLIRKVVGDSDRTESLTPNLQSSSGAFSVSRNQRVKIVDGLWPDEWIAALVERGNCYVSLHHSEGWCYPLFDAACRGTPVIATDYSGPTDYLDPRFHNLVRYTHSRVIQKYAHFNSEMSWADPDISHAAALMRHVYDHRSEALLRARQAAQRLRKNYSVHEIGEAAKLRVAMLDRQLRAGKLNDLLG